MRGSEERSDELPSQFMIEAPLQCLSDISIPKLRSILLSTHFKSLGPSLRFSPLARRSYHGKTEYGQQAPPKSELTVVVPLKRAYGSYVNHVGLVTFMITTATFTSFCVDLDSLADRMSIVLTLFLTIVATKFLVQERLPRVAFMTYLDVYFTGCFTFFVLVILSSVVSSLTQVRLSASTLPPPSIT